jgi:hypothetical protein
MNNLNMLADVAARTDRVKQMTDVTHPYTSVTGKQKGRLVLGKRGRQSRPSSYPRIGDGIWLQLARTHHAEAQRYRVHGVDFTCENGPFFHLISVTKHSDDRVELCDLDLDSDTVHAWAPVTACPALPTAVVRRGIIKRTGRTQSSRFKRLVRTHLPRTTNGVVMSCKPSREEVQCNPQSYRDYPEIGSLSHKISTLSALLWVDGMLCCAVPQ